MSTSLEPGGAPGGDPGRHRAGAHPVGGRDAVTPWTETQNSPDFAELRRRVRGFAFPMTVLFLAWYLLYVLASGYARGFMSQKLLGNINVAYVFGLLQFVSTFMIALLYSRHANRKVDPIADRIRHELEGR